MSAINMSVQNQLEISLFSLSNGKLNTTKNHNRNHFILHTQEIPLFFHNRKLQSDSSCYNFVSFAYDE